MDTKEIVHFKRACKQSEDVIFSWLNQPHMIEFWDNSKAHKEDIANFIHSRKQNYLSGTTQYFIGLIKEEPFAFLLGDNIERDATLNPLQKKHLSRTGNTIFIDFGIGNPNFLGKNLAAPTLIFFCSFYRTKINKTCDTFFIDPDVDNPRAIHVYKKAGFQTVGNFNPAQGAFVGETNLLMVKKF